MSDNKLERRVEHLESEIQTLRQKLDELSRAKPWWHRIAGTFEKDPMYEQAMKLGRKYRRAQRG
jgi:hypothetical protein